MTKRVLCYTIAFDLNGTSVFRQQARMLVASLLRSGFEGDIKVFHSSTFEIFDHPHINLEEIRIAPPENGKECLTAKYRLRHLLPVEDYDWVVFFDVDCIVNTPLNSWFEGPEIIRYVQETRLPIQLAQFNGYLSEDEMENLTVYGYNSGNFVIRADHFNEVAASWEEIDQSPALRDKPCWEQSSWNRLLLDTKLSTKPLADPSVDFYYNNREFMRLVKSPMLHFCGCDTEERMLAMQAKFLSNFHTDVDGTLIGFLEKYDMRPMDIYSKEVARVIPKQSHQAMSWTDVFPVFTDEMVEEFEQMATVAEKAELESFHGVEKVFNAQDKPHIVSVSLFWKHTRECEPDLPLPTRECIKNARQLGLARRFDPWEHYVEPLINHVPRLKEHYPNVVFRVYLAKDLEFLIPDLVEAGCEVHWMKSSSIRLNPGALWRYLPFEEQGKLITMLDGDLMEEAPKFIARTEAMTAANLGAWRQPLAIDYGPEGKVRYLPFLGCHSGMQGGNWPVRKLLDAFTWHCCRGTVPTSVHLPDGGHSMIEQARWPDYGFEEWFLTAVMYPRVASSGILTFLQPTDQSVFLLLDIEYVTWANSNSEIIYYHP